MSVGMQLFDVRQHQEFLKSKETSLARWVMPGMKPEALQRFALQDLATNEKLLACTPTSIYLGLLACAVSGLEPGPLKSEAFLVPFNNKYKQDNQDVWISEATFMAGWRGIKKQGIRASVNIVAHPVFERDEFDFNEGSKPFVHLKPPLKGGRGALIGAIAFAELPREGGLEIEWMDLEAIAKVRQVAEKGGRKSPAWEQWPDQMARKSVLRRIGKRLPMGEDYFKGALVEFAGEQGTNVARTLDQFTEGEASEVVNKAEAQNIVFRGPPPANAKQADGRAPEVRSEPGKKTGSGAPSSRPTPPPNSNAASGSPAPSSSAAQPASGSTQSASASAAATTQGNGTSASNSPTRPPASSASSNGSTARQASTATPAASSANGSNTTPSASTASEPSSSSENGADGGPGGVDFGDVAGEPSMDDDFDAAFGEDEVADSGTPTTRQGWLDAFEKWAAEHPKREQVLADNGWEDLMRGWTLACSSKAELEEGKPKFVDWSRKFFSVGRKADPAKNITALPADEGATKIKQIYNDRLKTVVQ